MSENTNDATGIDVLKDKYKREKKKLDKQVKKCNDAQFSYLAAKHPAKTASLIRVMMYANTLNWGDEQNSSTENI